MGKGKKKDKTKKEEVPSLSTLQISEAPEQPPQAEQVQEEEEEYSGLTGGGRKRNKPKKGKSEPQVAGTSAEVKEATPPVVEKEATPPQDAPPQPSQPSDDSKQKQKDEEDEDIGLGLSGPKKRNRKKKKPDSATAQVATDAPKVQQPPQSGAQSSVYQPVVTPIPAPSVPAPSGVPASSGVPAPSGVPSPWGAPKPTQTPQIQPKQTQVCYPPTQHPGPQTAHHPKQQPVPQPTPVPQPVPVGDSRGSAPKERQMKTSLTQQPMCLFKVPDKVLSQRPLGRQISVIVNYLRMAIQPIKIQRYDVSFKPDRPKKLLSVAYNEVIKQNFKNLPIGFDQRKNLYAYNYLPGVSMEDRTKFNITIKDTNGKDFAIEVSFKFTGTVDLSQLISYMNNGGTSLNPPTEAIQAVDVILRQGTLESYVKAGRQFFKRPSRPIDLGEGLEMWTGLFQSAIFTSQPFVNIDVAHKGFPKHQLLIDAYLNDFRLDASRPLEEQRGRGVEAFQHYLKSLKVHAYIGGDMKGPQREFICNEVVAPANRLTFTMNQGTPKEVKMTVAAYFEKEKKIRLRYPHLNCIWVGPRDKNIFYPMELLLVSYGQVSNKQMTEMQLSTLVKESATPPDDRKRKIEEVIKDMNYSKNEFFKKFGLSIGNEFVKVDAKILMPPKLEVGGTAVEPRRGAWQARRLLRAQSLDAWGFIAVDTDPRNKFDGVINMIMDIGRQMGMNIVNPMFTQFTVKIHDLMRTLQIARDKGVNFIFVVLSARGRDYYHKLKRAAEREVGVLTQCLKEFTATRKMNESTVRNIMLKVNSKLMGTNHALDNRSVPLCLQNGKTMLVGADVTHPSPDQTSIPSIAGVTASLDGKFSIYNISLSIQTPKKEVIVDFENMMVEHLQEFQKRQRELPSKIYVFRDGVSEGQFAQVMNSELVALFNAYKRLSGPTGKRPEVLFLLVQKRHHTRLFVPGTNANVEPGTVVDTQIVHPRELDFYLVSHQAIKGTARPTRYHAVCNDGRISQDEVEQLTFYLCHLYARCTRSVSYPTPTYYAHLACMRARSLTFGDRFSNADLERQPQRLRVLERMLQNSRMFFV